MGRWLERAENISRTIDSAAVAGIKNGQEKFHGALTAIGSAWGLSTTEPNEILRELIWKHPASSIYIALQRARENASQVAPLELVKPLNDLVIKLEESGPSELSATNVRAFVNIVIEGLAGIYKVIETIWFRREPLTEDELFQRFVQ